MNREMKIAIPIIILLVFLGGLFLLTQINNQPDSSSPLQKDDQTPVTEQPKAVLLDGLYTTDPNPSFTQNVTRLLSDAGFHVDLYQGENVTIRLLMTIQRYDLLILRLHSSIHKDKFLYLFSGEQYLQDKYVYEQLAGAVRKAYTFNENEGPFFAVNSAFLADKQPSALNGSILILMGCNGTGDPFSIQNFFQRGADAYVAWDGYVDLDYTDQVTLKLLRYLYLENLSLDEATNEVMRKVGPDPLYHSTLKYYSQTE